MNEALHESARNVTARNLQVNEQPVELTGTLERAEALLEQAFDCDSPLKARLHCLRGRLAHQNLQVAVLGQFKRGKSTFINALLGNDVLPTGVIPLTAVATFISWRHEPLVTVRFRGVTSSEEFFVQSPDRIRQTLFRFVAEEANPENRLGLERVDLFYPSPILENGTIIIDTPGVGSTLRHNTEAALHVLPECDAAFFVISADPPITEIELDYLRRLKSKTARVYFVLNKADYLAATEKQAVVDFLRKELSAKSLIEPEGQIFCVSARNGLKAKESSNRRALETSGMAELEDHIIRALASEKARWLADAVRSKAADILEQASAKLSLRVRALKMPIEELAAKSEAFQDALRSIEDQRRITRDLLAGDHRRLREALDARIDSLRNEIRGKVAGVIDRNPSDSVPKRWEETARLALSSSMQNEFEAAREPLVNAFAADAEVVLGRCQDRVNALGDRVRRTAAEIFNVSLGLEMDQEVFELGEDPYWVTESPRLSLVPDPSRAIDRLLPESLRRPRMRARMMMQAQELIVRNAENLRWAIVRGLDELFRRATFQFEERLDETMRATCDVISEALARRLRVRVVDQMAQDRPRSARNADLGQEAERALPSS